MADFQVNAIKKSCEIKEFIRFAWKVYRGNSFWIPPNISETQKFLSGKGHFFDHCQHRLFTLREKGQLVATVAAFYDRNFVNHWKKSVGVLGFFEAFPEKFEGVRMLLEEAESFLVKTGADTVQSPINGSIANSVGLLMNAYNQPPVFLMSYNPSYYQQYFTRSGYRPDQELLAFTIDLLDGRLRRKVEFLLRKADKQSEIKIRPFVRDRFREDSDYLARIYSLTFKAHWGYAPQSDEEFFEIINPFQLALESDFILFAEHKGVPVGFVLTVPDYNPVLKRLNGRSGFLSSLRFLWLKRKIHEARLIAIGVAPEWRGKNVAPLLVANVCKAMFERGYTKCEYSWVFSENLSSQDVAKKFYGDDYKKYLVYEKQLRS